jgi:hypothetical protein
VSNRNRTIMRKKSTGSNGSGIDLAKDRYGTNEGICHSRDKGAFQLEQGAVAEMIARIGRGHRGTVEPGRAQNERNAFRSKFGARCLAVVIALLWCNCALAAEPRVLLLRGWFGVFSTGMDSLANELKAKGIKVEVASHLYWSTALKDIVKERAAGNTGPLVLVGHSQGANNVIDMARSLEARKIPVDLLVTLAPFMQDPLPSNVVRAVNYYQSPGWGAPLTVDRGFHGKLSNINVADDWTIAHISIDKSTKIHADIAREIAAVLQAKEKVDEANPLTAAAQPPSAQKKLPPQAQAQ